MMFRSTAALVFFSLASEISAVACFTVKTGNWSDIAVWNTGRLPTLSDSIIIGHAVFFENDIIIEPQGSLVIENAAVLCGQYKIKISCGASFSNNGILKAKNLEMEGDGKNSGEIFISEFLQVNSCGNIFSFGAMSVGTKYQCDVAPADTFSSPAIIPLQITDTSFVTSDDSLKEKIKINVFPNPFTDNLEVDYFLPGETRVTLSFYDPEGKLAAVFYDHYREAGKHRHTLSTKPLALANGIYFIRFSAGENIFYRKALKSE